MNIEKLQQAIGAMGQALEEKGAASPQPTGPSKPPGQVLYESGIYYFADGFTYESTKPAQHPSPNPHP